MEMLVNAGIVELPVLYTLSVMSYARTFLGQELGIQRISNILLSSTLLVHIGLLLIRGFQVGACPVGSPWEALSLASLILAFTYWILEKVSKDQSSGVFVLSISCLMQFLSSIAVLGIEPGEAERLNAWQSLHAFSAIAGLCAVLLASVYGFLYLFLYWVIKRGRFGIFYQRIAPLQKLASLNHIATAIAFLAISIASTGGFYAVWKQGEFSSLVRLEVISVVILWLLYAFCLIGRRFLKLGGKRLAYLTALGLPWVILLGIYWGIQQVFHG